METEPRIMLIIPRPLLVAAAMALVLSACGDKKSQGAPPPPEVGVVQVRPGTVPLQKDLVGRLAAFRSADARARVPGVLERRVYEEGTDVKAGQVLFRIDPSQLQAELGQAKRQVAIGAPLRRVHEAGAGTVHLAQCEPTILHLGEEHVLAVVVPVARAAPKLLVEDLRGFDLEVATALELGANLALDQPQQHRPLRQPERHPGRLT